MTEKLISIVIPCKDEKDYVGRCIDSLLDNDYPNKEILVVDGQSRDGTRQLLEQYQASHSNFRLIDNPHQITPIALNRGIEHASGDYIMIAGAHAAFPANYIRDLLGYLESLDAAGVGGSLVTHGDHTVVGTSIARVLSNRMGVGNSLFRLGIDKPVSVDTIPFGIYKKEAFEKAGSYDERLVRNQDIELSGRIKRHVGPLYLVPSVACDYFMKGKFRQLARSGFRNGLWNILVLYLTRNLFSVSLRHVVPLFYLLFILVFLLLGWTVSGLFFVPLALVLFIYGVLLGHTALRINDQSSSLTAIIRAFVVLHFSYGLGSLVGLFRLDKLFKPGR
jgi:glycosyltransferase involved in cell wall biosynthesis